MSDLWTALLLLATGTVVGMINNLAGAGGVLALVALEEVCGLGSAEANRCLRPSAVGIGLGGMVGFRSRAHRLPARTWGYALATIPGAVAGSMLAIVLPVLAYRLVLAAVVVVIWFQQMRPGPWPRTGSAPQPRWLSIGLLFVAGLHMGFVQIGTGLVVIAALTAVLGTDLLRVNAAKMGIILLSAATSTTLLGLTGHIDWAPAAPVAVGAAIGSFLAARWSVSSGHGTVRVAVLAISVAVLLRIGWQIATGAS